MVKVSLQLALNAAQVPRADVLSRSTSDALLPPLHINITILEMQPMTTTNKFIALGGVIP